MRERERNRHRMKLINIPLRKDSWPNNKFISKNSEKHSNQPIANQNLVKPFNILPRARDTIWPDNAK